MAGGSGASPKQRTMSIPAAEANRNLSVPVRMVWWCIWMLALLVACSRTDPETKLRARIDALQVTIQSRQPARTMEAVTGDFTGNDGMDREALHNLLRAQFLAKADIGVTTGPLQVSMQGDHATVRFTAMLTGGNGGWIPEDAGAYQVTTGWRVEDGDWKLYAAQWSH